MVLLPLHAVAKLHRVHVHVSKSTIDFGLQLRCTYIFQIKRCTGGCEISFFLDL